MPFVGTTTFATRMPPELSGPRSWRCATASSAQPSDVVARRGRIRDDDVARRPRVGATPQGSTIAPCFVAAGSRFPSRSRFPALAVRRTRFHQDIRVSAPGSHWRRGLLASRSRAPVEWPGVVRTGDKRCPPRSRAPWLQPADSRRCGISVPEAPQAPRGRTLSLFGRPYGEFVMSRGQSGFRVTGTDSPPNRP